jgi:drug/metabolite transporter (DMT)-like permease
MDQATFLWALAATLLAGIQVFSQKVVAHEGRDSALNGIFGYGISGIIAAAIFLVFYDLPEAWIPILAIASISGIVHAAGSYIRIESLKFIDAVIYFPVNKVLGPLLVVFIGVWWFGENLNLYQYIGIAFSLTVPLLLVSSSEHHRQQNLQLGLILLVASTILTALTSPVMKAAIDMDATLFFSMLVGQGAGTFSSILLYAYSKREERKYFSLHARDIQLGLTNGVLQFFSFYAFLMALSLGFVSIVYVIHAHYILIPIILSVWWYKDHINMRKFVAIVVSSAAIALLGL